MSARLLLVLYYALLSHSLTIEQKDNTIISKTKVELKPLIISCQLDDIVTIAAPVVNTKEVLHYLTKPNGETKRIYIKQPSYILTHTDFDYNDLSIKHIKEDPRAIIRRLNDNYDILKPNTLRRGVNLEKELEASDISIGPMTVEDHGNWVISVFYKDLDDNWIELFQVVTVRIIETVPARPRNPVIKSGNTFKFSFAYPIKHIESCELLAPRSTFDRFYAKSDVDLDRCGYVIDNVTKADEGLWKIIGVGKIVYETEVFLKVLNNVT